MFQISALLFCVVADIVTGYIKRPSDICSRTDVSKDPRLESRQLDGLWYTQRILTQRFPSNSIFLYQFQGKAVWTSDWNATTQECQYRNFALAQRQSVKLGPFSPCIGITQILNTGEKVPIEDLLHWMPTNDILMFYRCDHKVRPNGLCTKQPFIRLLTRNIDITRRQLNIFGKKLRRLGVSLDSIPVVNIRENRCPVPSTVFSGSYKESHGRKPDRYSSI